MRKILIHCSFVLLLFLVSESVIAQINISEEPTVTSLMSKYNSLNTANSEVKAWRIQIIATNDRRKMESAVSKFRYMHPDIEYDWKHVAPYYQVYIGAYEKKEDFEGFLLALKRDFPSSIPVIERIEKSKLL